MARTLGGSAFPVRGDHHTVRYSDMAQPHNRPPDADALKHIENVGDLQEPYWPLDGDVHCSPSEKGGYDIVIASEA